MSTSSSFVPVTKRFFTSFSAQDPIHSLLPPYGLDGSKPRRLPRRVERRRVADEKRRGRDDHEVDPPHLHRERLDGIDVPGSVTNWYLSSRLASTNPDAAPTAVPMPPMTRPSNMKIRMTARGVAPMDFMMPMSFVFSITTMMSVLAMLNAATRTMSDRIQNMTFFSVRIQVNRFLLSSIQLFALNGNPPSPSTMPSPISGARYGSVVFTAIPITESLNPNSDCALARSMYTSDWSYSNMPELMRLATSNRRTAGMRPIGVST